VLAVLQNIDDGTSYPVQSPVAEIGRASTNDVVLSDETVSRLHAVLVQNGDGTFSIENRSELNGTQLNHQEIGAATVLSNGDLITVGTKTLRFSQAARSKPGVGSSATGDTPVTAPASQRPRVPPSRLP
jgi:pSer/pThr/pTyr-binding forkhead associated (FHA) protein